MRGLGLVAEWALAAAVAAGTDKGTGFDPVLDTFTGIMPGPSYPIARKGNGQAKVRRAAAKRRRRQAAKR